MLASKYVSFSLVFALMGKSQGKVFLIQFLFLIHSHNLIQEPCGIPLSLPCSVCIAITPKPEMSVSAAAYPKLHKIYKELVRQNETILGAEKERDALEKKQGNLKGLSKLTKKGELQSEIDRINERINLLKVGLSGISTLKL